MGKMEASTGTAPPTGTVPRMGSSLKGAGHVHSKGASTSPVLTTCRGFPVNKL